MKAKEQRKETAMAWLKGLTKSGRCIFEKPLTQDAINDQVSHQWLTEDADYDITLREFNALCEEMKWYVDQWKAMNKPLDTRDITYEARGNRYVAHEWGEYAESSVLAGQAKKIYLGTFETVEDVLCHFPQAQPSHPFLQPQNTFDHLPGEGSC